MKKTAFKTFVCSFVFSLFMIFGINGVFFVGENPQTQNINISNKNITLFLKKDASSTHAAPHPVKKIALSVLPELPAAPDKTPNFAETKAEAPEIIMADNSEFIPLEFGGYGEPENEALTISDELKLADNSLNEAVEIKAKPPIVAETLSISDGPIAELEIDMPAKQPQKAQKADLSEPIKLAAVYEPEEPQAEALAFHPDVSQFEQDMASNTPNTSDNGANLLIPLEKSSSGTIRTANRKIEITNQAGKNQVALADSKVSTQNIATPNNIIPLEKATPQEKENTGWETMAEKEAAGKIKTEDSPWVVAQGAKYTKNQLSARDSSPEEERRIQKLLNARHSANNGGSIQLAGDMVDNILIPIPKDILNKENLKPKLEFPDQGGNPTDEDDLDNFAAEKPEILDAQGKNIAKSTDEGKSSSKSDFLSSITSIFSGGSSELKEKGSPEGEPEKTGVMEKIKNKFSNIYPKGKILPAEIRLAFQPNRAEISGNTLRWIYAFAEKTKEDSSVVLEIRLDGTSDRALQQKRLNLLSNILNSKQVKSNNVKIVFTNREPNSFVIRTIKVNEAESYDIMKNNATNNTERVMVW